MQSRQWPILYISTAGKRRNIKIKCFKILKNYNIFQIIDQIKFQLGTVVNQAMLSLNGSSKLRLQSFKLKNKNFVIFGFI